MPKQFIVIGVIVIAAAIGLTGFYVNQLECPRNARGDFEWQDPALEEKYSTVVWSPLVIKAYDGLSPKSDFVDVVVHCAGDEEALNNYIRIGGGGLAHIWICVYLKNSQGQEIHNKHELVQQFAPVENEAEAASFVHALYPPYHPPYDKDRFIHGTSTASVDDGFLVKVTTGPGLFGCHLAGAYEVIYKVTTSGDVSELAVKVEQPDTEGTTCVD